MGDKRRSATLVTAVILIFGITAVVLAIVGGRLSGSPSALHKDNVIQETYCIYEEDEATGHGIAAAILLLCSQVVVMIATSCMCCGSPLERGGSRCCTIASCICSWVTFVIAESSLVTGAKEDAVRIGDSDYRLSCEALRKAVFISGAIFGLATTILNVLYYFIFLKASSKHVYQTDPAHSTIGMTMQV